MRARHTIQLTAGSSTEWAELVAHLDSVASTEMVSRDDQPATYSTTVVLDYQTEVPQ